MLKGRLNKISLFLRFLMIIPFLLTNSKGYGQTATFQEEDLLMGNLAELVITLPLPTDSSKVEFPLLKEAVLQKRKYVSLLNDTIELLVKHTESLEKVDGTPHKIYRLKIQAFDSGRYQLPPFDFMIDGEKLQTNQLSLNVIPVKVNADDKIDDFSDISEPFELNPNPEELENEGNATLIWWLSFASIILLILILYLYYRYRKTGKILPIGKPVSPYSLALKRLTKLKQQNLPQKGKTKEYYTRLTEILRKYLNSQFGVKTMEKTSAEILVQMDNADNLSEYSPLLKSIFQTADFVKFAKVNPSSVENDRCMREAEKFINLSRPAEIKEEKKGGK